MPSTRYPCPTRRSTFVGWTLVLYAAVSIATFANAAELDIAVSERDRKTYVAPLCARLVQLSTALTNDEKYLRALCLKFGIDTAPQTATALVLLREAAVQGHAEAQLALADTLQLGNGAEQREALHWYERAGAAGDSRAMSRAARLSLRVKAPVAAVENAPDPYWPTPEDQDNLPKGYHCHRYPNGQQMCHGGMFN